jgi:hypothetical protein
MRALLLAFVLVAPSAHAQKWKDAGKTASGNMVSVETRSIKSQKGLISATVRVVFTTPVKAAKGTWASSRTMATFDCAKRTVAAKENAYFSDAAGTKLVERNVNKIPGFGPVLDGSMGQIALDYLCKKK